MADPHIQIPKPKIIGGGTPIPILSHVVLGAGGKTSTLPGDVAGVAFKPAKFFRWWSRGFSDVRKGNVWIVIHAAECAEVLSAAENLQAYAHSMNDGRVASWTYACDANSTTQSVLERYVAFHAPPLNDYSIGVELAGYSNQLASGWDDDFSREMLDSQLVPLLVDVCRRTGIPARTISDDTLRQGLSMCAPGYKYAPVRDTYGGIVTHVQVSRVFGKSDHHDPGPAFPLQDVVSRVVDVLGGVEA